MQETSIFDGESHGFRWRFSQLNQSAVTFHRSADVAVTSPSGRGGRWSEEALGAAAHVDRLCPGQYPGCGRPKRGPTWLGTGRGDRNERWLAGDDDDDEYEFKLMNDGSWMTTPGPATGFSSPALALWFTYQQVLKESNYIVIYCNFLDIFLSLQRVIWSFI